MSLTGRAFATRFFYLPFRLIKKSSNKGSIPHADVVYYALGIVAEARNVAKRNEDLKQKARAVSEVQFSSMTEPRGNAQINNQIFA